MIEENTLREFLEVLSSKAPVPGGGGASALGGAMGNALGQMVANLTIGKKRYQDVEDDVRELLERMVRLQQDFVNLADLDAEVFTPLAAAYGLPSGTEEEKAHKDQVMEENLLAASLAPVQIMEKAVEMLDILAELAQKGSRMAVSDVGVGVQFVRASLLGAVMNVYINTKSMKNREKAGELNAYADRMVEEGTKKADAIYSQVLGKLRPQAQS
ncbi:MAG: cyclodeaminase/cyclohydrolase family protein [Lachnospiraceae bacterium]|nr:cyclodeaminase/cyclohydrolase family protein [Lachnospiraceae bacterium]